MLNFPRWKIIVILTVCLAGLLTAFPNFLPSERAAGLPDFMPSRQINLGLDLQGGSHMLLEVDVPAVISERLDAVEDDVRTALRSATIGYRGLRIDGEAVVFRLRDSADAERARETLADLAQPITTGLFATNARDLEITDAPGGGFTLQLTEAGIEQRRIQAVTESIETLRRRIDPDGTLEPTIQRQGEDRILLQVPGVQDPQTIRDRINTEAKLTFHMLDERTTEQQAAAGRVPAGSLLLPMQEGGQIVVSKRAALGGDRLVDAQPGFDQNNQPVVTFRCDTAGGRKFGYITRTNVGKRFAIVLDDEVLSAPVIREPILGGSGQISGGFTVEEATELALLLRAGALPAPLTIVEERTVGPDLGADSIAAGELAGLIGLTAVVVFIILSYGWFGVVANVALMINIALIMGALSTLQATLTLPGIAGIVLTIGMAVDANVLVFERIREEIRGGKTPFAAIDSGYSQALSTILDANITTLIAAILLFQFGSGPVKGFAVTLSIGIVTSVFTAVTLTRFMLVTWLRRRRPAQLPI